MNKNVIKNILSELCVSLGSSFGTNAIVLAFMQLTGVRVVSLTQWWLTFCSNHISGTEIINGEKPEMKCEPKRPLIGQKKLSQVSRVWYFTLLLFVTWLFIL